MSKTPKTPITEASEQFAFTYNTQNEVIRNLFAKKFPQTCMQPLKDIQEGITRSQLLLKSDFTTFLQNVKAIVQASAKSADKYYEELKRVTPIYTTLEREHAALVDTHAALVDTHATLKAVNSDIQSQLDLANTQIQELSAKLQEETAQLNGLTQETDLQVDDESIDDLRSYLKELERNTDSPENDNLMKRVQAEIERIERLGAAQPAKTPGGSRRRRRRQVKRSRRN
jgi:chromosome segregation ATPase